jgi:hypothetical protein
LRWCFADNKTILELGEIQKMRNLTLDEITEIEDRPFREIREYAEKALRVLGLSWRITGVYKNLEGYWIQFFDESNSPHEVTLYNQPPNPDEGWYIQEITRQLQ